MQFASLFDVVGDVKTAELAIQAIFGSRQDLALQLQFPDTYWNELTPESALIARLYIAHCKATNVSRCDVFYRCILTRRH